MVTGRIGFYPYPTLWVDANGMLIEGIVKSGADLYIRPFKDQTVTLKGIRIVFGNCVMLGVAKGDSSKTNLLTRPIPTVSLVETLEIIGEVLEAQCIMGIMNPGYSRTHRACATLCIRGGQPVFFSAVLRDRSIDTGSMGCGGTRPYSSFT